MKIYIRRLLLSVLFIAPKLIANTCTSCHDHGSHTFMFTRPITQHLGIWQQMWHNIMFEKKGPCKTAFQFTTVFQESTDDTPAAQYFLLPCKNKLLVSGDANTSDLRTRDIRAEWIGLPSNFRGFLSVEPKQRQFGLFVEINQGLGSLCGNSQAASFLEDSWISVTFPIVAVENNLSIRQTDVINPAPQFPSDIIEAFNQPSWLYGKMDRAKSIVQLADFNIKLGKTYMDEDNFLVAYYTSLTFPTGNKQCPNYIFNPVAGSNAHFGYGAGVNFQLSLLRDCANFALCFFLNLEGTFYARNTQLRTYDLNRDVRGFPTCLPCFTSFEIRDRPLARYLQLIDLKGENPNALIPGVNVLTLKSQVHPYGFVDFSTGFRWKGHSAELEFGYNIWGHGPEKIQLLCPFPHRWGIAGTIDPSTGLRGTASKSTICTLAPNDVEVSPCPAPCTEIQRFVPLIESDIDIRSGAARSAFNHKVHIAGGFNKCGKVIDGFVGVGIFYDLPMKNAALPLMGGWAKFGASF